MIKLNNKGQTLIMFVMLIPLLLLIVALVVDSSLLYKEKIRLQNTTKTILKNTYDKKDNGNIEKTITDLCKKNNIKTNNLKIENNNYYLKIENDYKIDSVFGKIIGIKKYHIKTSQKATIRDNKIVILKE